MRKKTIRLIVCLVTSLIISGCDQKPAAPIQTKIEETFIKGFNDSIDIGYPVYVSTHIAGKTFWIYVATEKELWTYTTFQSVDGVIPQSLIKFLDIKCNYADSVFNLKYIFLKYNDEELTKERDIFDKPISGTTIVPDLSDETMELLGKVYHSIGNIIDGAGGQIDFFAICIADIKKGIQLLYVSHRIDTEQYLLGMLPVDEFQNRMIVTTEGNEDIKNDKFGLHMDYNDISFVDFLREQIINNSKSQINEMEKFEPDKLKSLESLDEIVLKNVYSVTTKYEFKDFILVEVEDVISHKKKSTSKTKLATQFASEPASQ